MADVTVIGGGLAGCEAAWQLAEAGFSVQLLEMKPVQYTPAHHYEGLAELVCSNSLKADRINSAAGLLKAEMTRLGSLLMQCARKSAVAAGGALAVDRKQFSDLATDAIRNHPNITLETAVVDRIPDTPVVVATGPLTEGALAADIEKRCGTRLSFFDAAAPIVSFESLDKEKVFFAARYGRGDADYINCPMNKAEYEEFYQALIGAERAPLHDCDKDAFRVYEGCMPIEVLASRGMDTMRFGPLKPVGLTDPRTGHRPWAVVQLRRENQEGTMPWNDPGCFALRVRGDSMINAGILSGDKVVVRPQQSADDGQIVVARIEDEATVKRLRRRNGQIWLMPENDNYSPIDGTNAEIIGIVKAVVREY